QQRLGHRVDLVDDQDRGPVRALQRLHHRTVARAHLVHDLIHRLDEEEVDVGILGGVERHLEHVAVELPLRVVHSGGVHQGDLRVRAVHHPEDPVAGGLGLVADDGELLAGQPVEQGALAHVGAADERGKATAMLRGHAGSDGDGLTPRRSAPERWVRPGPPMWDPDGSPHLRGCCRMSASEATFGGGWMPLNDGTDRVRLMMRTDGPDALFRSCWAGASALSPFGGPAVKSLGASGPWALPSPTRLSPSRGAGATSLRSTRRW